VTYYVHAYATYYMLHAHARGFMPQAMKFNIVETLLLTLLL